MRMTKFESRKFQNKRANWSIPRASVFLAIAFVFLQISGPMASRGSSTEIVVRFLDGRTGKPLTKVGIQFISWTTDDLNPKSEKIMKIWDGGKTDKEGRLFVQFTIPLPQHLSYRSPNELRECSNERFSVEDALRSGILAKYSEKCGKLKAIATARPGEIVVFDRKYKFLD